MKLQGKLGNPFAAVVCGRDKKSGSGLPTRCPCVFDHVVDKEVLKWDACPESAYCAFMHEVAHITQQPEEMRCNPTDPKPHGARGSGEAQKEFHKKIAKKQLECLVEAQMALMRNPDYSTEKKAKCTKYNLLMRANIQDWK